MSKRHVIGYTLTALLCIGIGTAANGSPTEAAEATPTPAVTKTVEKTKTETVEVTPAACLKALDLADEGFTAGGEGMGAAASAFDAILQGDVGALQQSTEDIQASTKTMDKLQPRYQSAKAECRASAAS